MRAPRIILASLSLAACTGDEAGGSGTDTDGTDGQALYEQPIPGGNTFTCSTCHALSEPAPDNLRRPGHPIGDATRRPSWKNGQLDNMLGAVNSCLTEWMNHDPWTADNASWLALHDYLDTQAPAGAAPALSFEIVQPPADLSGGDPAAGEATFNGACAVCHGDGGGGTQKAPGVAGIGLEAVYAAGRIRTSGRLDSSVYQGLTGGIMPFWSADRLSEQELLDVVAWLTQDSGGTTGGTASGTGGSTSGPTSGSGTSTSTTTTGTGGNCASTHAKVGWTASLSTFAHGVTGDAEIIDDCTVRISNFNYDGNGIDVRVYGGVSDGGGVDYNNGYAMTGDLIKAGGYSGVTLDAILPMGTTLDELDGISVWCVAVGVDFGSGTFAP